MLETFVSRVRAERGAAMVEYALLIALIAAVTIGAIWAFGGGVGNEFNEINSSIDIELENAGQ